MRSLLLILVLQLLFALALSGGKPFKPQAPKYEFGDLISFKMTTCGTSYKHFAVYVGDEPLDGKNNDEDIFHRLRDGTTQCGFGKISNYKPEDTKKATEYIFTTPETTPELMKLRIRAIRKDCMEYDLFKNNCEHVATYVRYGVKYCRQTGTGVQIFCNNNPKTCKHFDNLVKKLQEEEKKEEEVLASCSESTTAAPARAADRKR